MTRASKWRNGLAGLSVSVLLHAGVWWAAVQAPRRAKTTREPVSVRIAWITPPADPVSEMAPVDAPDEGPAPTAPVVLPRTEPSARARLADRTPPLERAPPPIDDRGVTEPSASKAREGRGPADAPSPTKSVPRSSSPSVGGADEPPDGRPSASGSVRDLAKIDLDVRAAPTPDPNARLLPPTEKPKSKAKLDLKPVAGGGFRYDDSTFSARIDVDGSVVLRDKGPQLGLSPGRVRPGRGVQPLVIEPPSVSVSFDVTDMVMRLAGDDPYFHRKLTFLRETLDLRVALAKAACQERLTEALYSLKTDLQRIWDDATMPVAVRRRHLFQLWDDCAEDSDDEKIQGYAAQARVTVMAFIRAQLPVDSPLAFPNHELVALNRRRKSSVIFDPYGTLAP